MSTRSRLFIFLMYFAGMIFFAINILTKVHAEEFLAHDKIMEGFVHAQKAPQMGRPRIYLPTKKMFKGYKHKKRGKPHGQQKLGGRRASPTPSPTGSPVGSPSGTVSPSPSPSGTGNGRPLPVGTPIIASGSVDLRYRDSPIKDQIGPICTAYAGNAGVENLLGKDAPDFSEDYTFSLYGRYSVEAFASYVPGKPLVLSSFWPRGGSKKNPLSVTDHQLVSILFIGDGDIEGAKKALQAGHPVYMGLEVPGDMASCLASIRPTTRVTSGGHAVLVVGYREDNSNKALGGGYLIIKNSWSEACGDHGYQYLPFSYCEKSYCYFYDMSQAK